LRTFSKAYGLSGLRLGYGLADENVINYLNNARQPFNVNYLAQVAGEAALDDEKFLNRTLQLTKEGKTYLYEELKKLNLRYIESATNFILVNMEMDSGRVFAEMMKRGVIVRDMSSYGLDKWIRVTIGNKKENKRFITTLAQILKGG
jgi:histidinol-phosphate aminotransferase